MENTFRIVSYNILANAYARLDRYPQVDPEALNWETRKYALARKLVGFNADILCLQEVEGDAYTFLEQSLSADGYLGIYAGKAQNRPDGCAVFFRQERLRFRSSEVLYYHDGNGAPDSGHLALILSFERETGLLHVANTHLKWDRDSLPEERHLGYRQLRELLEHMTSRPYAARDAFEDPPDRQGLNREKRGGGDFQAPEGTWIVCGDFNAPSDSPLVRELLTQGFRDAYAGHEQATCNPNHRAKRIDYLFCTADLSALPFAIAPIEDLTPLPSATEPSDHLAIMAAFTSEAKTQRRP